MNVAVQMEFKADRKEPLGDMIRRVAAQFERNGIEPGIVATFSDNMLGALGMRTTSAVERALKKYPHLARFERNDPPVQRPGIPPVRRLTNVDVSNTFPIADILALADGMPRSLPFHTVSVLFTHADFGRADFHAGLAPPTGVTIGDSWWVNGRNRDLIAFYAVDAEATSKTLPGPPAAIAAVLAGLGKPKRTAQFVPPKVAAPGAVPSEIAAVNPIIAKYRGGMKEMLERISLPHDLPPASAARQSAIGASGPLKPALVDAFKPRGYDCRGSSGTFTLRRRTATNHIVDVELDVGTWSRSLTFMFHLRGPSFNATLIPPVTTRDEARQYPIGDTANWTRIVANVAAIVDELERTFVVEIERAVGPAPEWFEPGR